MVNNYNNGGYPQGGYQQGGSPRQKKVKINQWEGEGYLRPYSSNPNDPINYKPSPDGNGGSILAIMECSEPTGRTDNNGQPQISTTRVPICVFTNKNITAQQLQNVIPGMKVHVVGRLGEYSYEDKKNPGQKKTIWRVNAFVFDIREVPMQQGYAPQGYAPQGYAPQGYAPQQGYQQPYQPQYPAYPPQPVQAQAPQPPYYRPAQGPVAPQAPTQAPAQAPVVPQTQAPAQAPVAPQAQAPATPQAPAQGGYGDQEFLNDMN